MSSFAYYGAIDRFISSLALYFSVGMAHPCVEGGYHAQSIGFRELAGSEPCSVVFFVFNQFYVFNRKTGDALRSIISSLLFGGFFNSDFSSSSSNLQKFSFLNYKDFEVLLIQSFNDQFSIAWNLAIDLQCFFEAFSGALLAQSGDGAPAWGDYPYALSNFLSDQSFLFGNASL